MQEMHLYEYAIIRLVPKVEREEFMNVGVILYCSAASFLKVKSLVDPARLAAFSKAADLDEINTYLHSFDRICAGRRTGGTIGELPLASRFRWLTASRSTILQCSKVHSGYSYDPEATLMRLFEQQVL
jgi:hypothetical protein